MFVWAGWRWLPRPFTFGGVMGFKEDAVEKLESAHAWDVVPRQAAAEAQVNATLALVELQEEANRIARAQVYASLGLREQALKVLDE